MHNQGRTIMSFSATFTRRQFIQSLSLLALSPYFKKTSADDSGREFNLSIAQTMVNFSGKPCLATTVNGTVPAPTLYWQEGEAVTIHVTNLLNEKTSIHWHGLILPYFMDGAHGVSFSGIEPHSTFTYRFKVTQSGTYWYHSHSGMQEQLGLYGAIVITPLGDDDIQPARDYVIVLSDWTDEQPMTVLDKLKKESSYYNFNQLTAPDFIHDVQENGLDQAISARDMWSEMRMNPTDLSDITASTYCYLINGKTTQNPWIGHFKQGEKIRLRFINAAAQTFFDVRIPNLKMTVIQADGQRVEPVEVDEFRIGSAENYDVLITPTENVYTLFAQSMDRTGYACATLAVQDDLRADSPPLDKAQPLSMMDMMGSMSNAVAVHHARTEYGASVDMRVDTPRTNLDDAGVGLRDNGRRVLTYADLRTIGGMLDNRPVQREIELHLTGNMQRYSWSFDGVEFSESTPVHFRYGERLRIIFVNDTMMAHPIHLHGMWCELENAQGAFQVRKHTIVVQPAQRIQFLVTADALGYWALHCHLFYHMHAGMFRVVVVS
jgi:FtsP/CotA-like multicopper oxidase with cupredoxin domain